MPISFSSIQAEPEKINMFNPVKSIQTVSEFTSSVKGLLETSYPFINLQGEVSNLRIPYSGHMYFILKDDKAQIRSVLFKGQRRFMQNDLKDGDHIICRGRISLYEPRGEYQIVVDSVQRAGSGNLHMQFTALKEKLQNEGLFAQEKKKTLPKTPHKICLITSPTGAAVHDFLDIAYNKHPQLQVEIIPTAMQGNHAPQQITQALKAACKRKWADIIVLCRGGGSIEDLWAFNDEILAREIAGATLPVVSAIGHEVDFTIADFTADLRCPTPTAAAETIIPNIAELKRNLQATQEALLRTIIEKFSTYADNLQHQFKFLGDPRSILEKQQLKVDHMVTQLELTLSKKQNSNHYQLHRLMGKLEHHSPERVLNLEAKHFAILSRRLLSAQEKSLSGVERELQEKAILLDAMSPLRVLGRGYSIITDQNNRAITSVKTVKCHDKVSIRVQDGLIKAETTKTIPDAD